MINYIYYFVYQFVKKGYKKEPHIWTKTFLSIFFIPVFLGQVCLNLTLIFNKFIEIHYMFVWISFTIVSIPLSLKFLESRYGVDGSNRKKIELLEKKFRGKKRNQFFDGLLIIFVIFICMIINVKLFWILKKY
jgi:hypothetical protein